MDPAKDFREQICYLAELIASSRHVVVCTGAGISTNAGIRDYRGPDGIWTEAQAAGVVVGEPGEKGNRAAETPWDESMYRLLPAAVPTLAHRALTQLATTPTVNGTPLIAHIISQNEDGLHLRSGLPPNLLSEIHGNAFIECCGHYKSDDSDSDLGSSDSSSSDSEDAAAEAEDEAAKAEARRLRPAGCGAAIVRDFVTYHGETYRRGNAAGRHVTRRACPHCRPQAQAAEAAEAATAVDGSEAAGEPPAPLASVGGGSSGGTGGGPLEGVGWLHDSTVDFGEMPGGFPWGNNSVHNVSAAKYHMQRADLVLVLGSSLSILANYFRPWSPESKWAKAPPKGLRLATRDGAEEAQRGGESSDGHAASTASGRIDKGKGKKKATRVRPSVCRLAIVNRGKALDEDLASIKIEADVDAVCEELLRQLGLPLPPPYRVEDDPLRKRVIQPNAGEPSAQWTF